MYISKCDISDDDHSEIIENVHSSQNKILNTMKRYGAVTSGRVSNQNGVVSKLYDDEDITIEWNASESQPRFLLKKQILSDEPFIVYGFRIKGKSRAGTVGPVNPTTFRRKIYHFFSEEGQKNDQFNFNKPTFMECGVCAGAIFTCKFFGGSAFICYEIRRQDHD